MYSTVIHGNENIRGNTVKASNIKTLEKTAWNIMFSLSFFFFKKKNTLKIKGIKCEIGNWDMLFHAACS